MKIQKYESFNLNEANDNTEEKEIKNLLKKVKKNSILSFATADGKAYKLAITYDSKLELYELCYADRPNSCIMAMGDTFMVTPKKMAKTEEVIVWVEDRFKK